ncbi:hypothetical protein ACOMHN_040706 [Nucella lapillus]
MSGGWNKGVICGGWNKGVICGGWNKGVICGGWNKGAICGGWNKGVICGGWNKGVICGGWNKGVMSGGWNKGVICGGWNKGVMSGGWNKGVICGGWNKGDLRETSDYQTAEDTLGMDSTLDREEGGDEGEAQSSAISLLAGESGSEFLHSQNTTGDLEVVGDSQEKEEDLEGEGDVSQEGGEGHLPRATRAAVNTSTPIPGNNKARRGGRKTAK